MVDFAERGCGVSLSDEHVRLTFSWLWRSPGNRRRSVRGSLGYRRSQQYKGSHPNRIMWIRIYSNDVWSGRVSRQLRPSPLITGSGRRKAELAPDCGVAFSRSE